MKRSFAKEDEFIINAYYTDRIYYQFLNNKVLFSKIMQDGKIEKLKWYKYANIGDSTYRGGYQNIINDKKNNRFIIFGGNRTYLDYDFNITDVFSYFDNDIHISKNACSVIFPGDKYLVSVLYENSETGQDPGLAFYDKDLKLKNVGIYLEHQNNPNIGDFFDVHFSTQNFDFIDTSEIFFSSTSNWLNYFSVGKVNSKLEPYWLKYYSLNDENRYYGSAIIATSDGGFILVGGKGNDPNANNNIFPSNMSAWMQKFDSDGNTVSTIEPNPNAWAITVYPNPSAGDFNIKIEGDSHDAKLMIYDLQGRMVESVSGLNRGDNTAQCKY